MKAKEKRVFVHIPKTAGRAVKKALVQKLQPEKNGMTRFGYFRVRPKVSWINRRRMRRSDILSGHLSVGELRDARIDVSCAFTVVREPVSRCLSFYYMTRCGQKNLGRVVPIKEYFENDHPTIIRNCHNRATFQLGDYASEARRSANGEQVLAAACENLARFRFFLVYEHLQDDIERFGRDEISANLPTNTLSDHTHRVAVKDLSAAELESITRINKLDQKLYAYATQLRQERIRLLDNGHVA